MVQMLERSYDLSVLPINADIEKYRVPYTPEQWTDAERYYLECFWTNLDRPVFCAKNLPSEIPAALMSRYSRSTESARRLFWKEYVQPILFPDLQKGWEEKSVEEKEVSFSLSRDFKGYVNFLHQNGGMDKVVNVQRGRQFFERWLAGFGDDSIAELGGAHIFIEGASNIAVNEIQKKRIGISPLEKSSRYVSFAEQLPDGSYQYVVPGEIKGTKYERQYKDAMDTLFRTYSELQEPYLNHIKTRYPKGEDETQTSFNASRSAKRFDDLRDLLPFSTRTNVGLFGNGRAFEDLVNRMVAHELGEVRYWGQMLCNELSEVVPSFVLRPKTKRGAQSQRYRSNMKALSSEIAREILGENKNRVENSPGIAKLLSFTPNAEVEILSTYIFPGDTSGFSLEEIRLSVENLDPKDRAECFAKIFRERNMGQTKPEEITRDQVRFNKVPRAFENAHYLFEVTGKAGDFRDLHRHRMMTQDRQRFNVRYGVRSDEDLFFSSFETLYSSAVFEAIHAFKFLNELFPDVAQYAVPFGAVQRWYMNLSAREIYWMVELRTGPQGRTEYRKICQEIARLAIETDPNIFAGLKVDNNDYRLSRRESEKKIAAKIEKLEEKNNATH